MRTSTNYGLKLPEGTDNVKRKDFVDNFEKIDLELKNNDTQVKDIANKVDNIKIADATTAQKGIVKLNTAINSTSITEATTPSATKQAYDKGVEALNKANEAFTSASNGKSYIAGKVGNVSSGNTFTQIGDRIQTDKNTAAINIKNKGVSASGTEALASLVSKIANISIQGMGGKNFLGGVINHTNGTRDEIFLNFNAGSITVDQPNSSYSQYPYVCVTKVGGSFYPFQSSNSVSGIYYDSTRKILSISSSVSTGNFPFNAWGE